MSSGQLRGANKKKCPACDTEFTGTHHVVCPHDSTLLMPVKPSLVGSMLGQYHILAEIGQGGMSIVYKGRHDLMDRTVAIKMLSHALLKDQTNIMRFKNEAQAVAHLSHKNIITVHDTAISPDGQPYLAMEYLTGEGLSEVIRRDGSLNVERTLKIFVQVCDALEHAHQKGVIHRDLKSSNIILIEHDGKKDFVKVVDFGIAKLLPSSGKQVQNLTHTGEIFGSPIYMSPEQCQGAELGPRSDIYSTGVMMYEALTGHPPLMGETIVETMEMHVNKRPPSFNEMRPDLYIPPAVQQIVFRALEKVPENRWPSMAEFRDNLDHVIRTDLPNQRASLDHAKAIRLTRQSIGSDSPAQMPKPSVDSPSVRESAIKASSGVKSEGKVAASQAPPPKTNLDGMQSFKNSDLRKLEQKKREGKLMLTILVGALVVILVVGLVVLLFNAIRPH